MALKTAPLSLAFWATASMVHAAALQPMASSASPQSSNLTPMGGNTPAAGAPALTSMGTLAPAASPLTGMEATTTSSATLTTMARLVPASGPVLLSTMGTPAPATGLLSSMEVPTTPSTTLTIMQPKAWPPLPGPLIVLVTPTSISTTINPMRLAAPDTDLTLTPLSRPGTPEIMRGRTAKTISNPVAALEPLAPPLVITPTHVKPLVLKKPKAKPIVAASGNTGVLGTAGAAVENLFSSPFTKATPAPQGPALLTDSELSPNPNIPTVTRPQEQLIAIDVTVNDIRRRGLLEVYQADDQTLWMPLSALSQLFEIPLTVNAAAGVAQGWYLSPSNTVVITMAQNQATIGANTHPTNGEIEKQAADLYLTPNALEKWFGITTKLDFHNLRIAFTTPNPLPGDLHIHREEAWDKAQKNLRNSLPSDTIIPGYSNFSLPVVRIGANSNFNHSPGSDLTYTNGLTLQSQNDIMGVNSTVALAFSQSSDGTSGLSGGSLLMEKTSEKADLMGPLHATYFGVGDITPNSGGLAGGGSGRGVRASNRPAGSVSDPDQYVLSGPAPLNWDVEVYQDQALVAFNRVDNTGTYRFNALPLKAGRNVFRIVMYGPNGEKSERRETIYLGDNIPARGTWQYDAAIYQPNRHVIPGLPGEASSSAVTAQAQLTTGLTKNWAATLSGFQSTSGLTSSNTSTTATQQGVGVGLRGSLASTYLTSDAFTTNAGSTFQSSLRTTLANFMDFRLSQSRNFGFSALDRDELTTTAADLSIPFRVGHANFGTTYGLTRTTYQTQPERHEITQRTSLGLGGLNATNELSYATQGNSSQINGVLETAVHVFKHSFNASLNYQPDQSQPFQQFAINTQVPVAENQTANLTYTQQLSGLHNANLTAGMYWTTGPYSIGVQAQAGSTGNIGAGLNLATALVPKGGPLGSSEPMLKSLQAARWELAPPNASLGRGQAAVRVYVDENGNNAYDPGEPLLPNVTVYNRQRGGSKNTNAQGVATFTDLTPGTLTRFDLDLTSLPDIYLKPVSDTLNVKPHTGDNGILNYALHMYGEISGQASTPSGQPVQNLPIALFDSSGTQLDKTTTEYDGYYTFGALPFGTYSLATTNPTPTVVLLTRKARLKVQNIIIQ